MMKTHRLILLATLGCAPVFADQAQDIDAVLDGFDNNAGNQGSIDAVLDGFDNTTPQTDTAVDDVLSGFDSAPAGDSAHTAQPAAARRGSLNGELTLSATYNYAHDAPSAGQTDWRGLSRLRGKLNLEYDYRFDNGWRAFTSGYGWYDAAYGLNGRSDYADEVLEEYESELELGETFAQGKLNRSTDLTLGRKIVVWGKSDNLRVTDVLNPLDMREIGMVDIEDLRLPLTMAKLDHYIGDWGLSAIAIPEMRFNKNAPFGSDFYPMPTPAPRTLEPDHGGGNSEYALAANGIFSGWDLSLYWAQLYDDTPYFINTGSGLEGYHARLTFNGIAANAATGNWLWKAEAAHFDGLRYTGLPNETKRRTDLLLGAEYAGFRDTTLSLEVANRHIHDYEAAMAMSGYEKETWQTALRYTGEFMHARLTLTALATVMGEQMDEGGFVRLQADYELANAVNLSGGVINYLSGDAIPFSAISNNDRVFAQISYSF